MIYFTSDFHFGHRGIILMQNRPFRDVQEMNGAMICNYNDIVHKTDIVYILGDISHHMKIEETEKILDALKGRKILIRGNHDKSYNPALFEKISDFETISVYGMYLALMHYPMLSWPKKNQGSIQLHGHIHAGQSYNEENAENGIRRYDVGVDANNFCPVSAEQIKRFFEVSI